MTADGGASAAGNSGWSPGPGWNLTWSDDFTGPDALRDWTVMSGGGGWGNKQLQTYTPSAVTQAPGGGLVLTATRGAAAGQYLSARLETKGRFQQEYGLFAARIKLPPGRGLWPALWMEGADAAAVPWPQAGEIDVIEDSNKDPDLVSGFAHAPGQNYGAYVHLAAPLSAGYHVYAIDWTPTGITWLIDGHAYGHTDTSAGSPFAQPFFLILDLAVGGTWPGPPDAGTRFPAQMDVSWIRVYRQAP